MANVFLSIDRYFGLELIDEYVVIAVVQVLRETTSAKPKGLSLIHI